MSGQYSSSALMSKETLVAATVTAGGPCNNPRSKAAKSADRFSWRTITPLGLPVDPDV